MKNSPLATVLLVLLACAALGALILCPMYVKASRELRGLQSGVAGIQARQQYMMSLANDALEYSKRNPQIDPILEAAGIKPKAGGPTNNNLAPKTGSK
jgi:hypothetical protein